MKIKTSDTKMPDRRGKTSEVQVGSLSCWKALQARFPNLELWLPLDSAFSAMLLGPHPDQLPGPSRSPLGGSGGGTLGWLHPQRALPGGQGHMPQHWVVLSARGGPARQVCLLRRSQVMVEL